jgi:hypothetical protein
MAKKKKADPIQKAKKELQGAPDGMRAETRKIIEEALARVAAANEASKAQAGLAKAAEKEARLRVKELESVLKGAKAEVRAKEKADKAAKQARKASERLGTASGARIEPPVTVSGQ